MKELIGCEIIEITSLTLSRVNVLPSLLLQFIAESVWTFLGEINHEVLQPGCKLTDGTQVENEKSS